MARKKLIENIRFYLTMLKRVFLVLPTTFNLVQRITVVVFFLQLGVILKNTPLQKLSYLSNIESKWSLDRTQNGSPSAFAFQSSAPQRARICLLNPITAPGQMFSQRKMFNANTRQQRNIQIWSRATTFEENRHLGKTSIFWISLWFLDIHEK